MIIATKFRENLYPGYALWPLGGIKMPSGPIIPMIPRAWGVVISHFHFRRSLRSCKAPSELAAAAAANTAAAANLLLRKHQIASIFQHYYPEGHWGYVVLLCAFLVQVRVARFT